MLSSLRIVWAIICLFGVAADVAGQVPNGFHPRYCLLGMEDSQSIGLESILEGNVRGTGSFAVQHEYSYYKDSEGNLQALCVTRQVEGTGLETRASKKQRNKGNERVRLMPNPAQDEVIVEGAWSSSVYFFDAFGRQIFFERLGTDLKIDIGHLPCGIYTVKIDRQGVVYTLPLLIQR